ncbi:DUF2905 domain-containing protein [Seramator thermalis]
MTGLATYLGIFASKKENTCIYIPITSMIVISIVLTLIVNLIRYFKP